MKNNSRLLLPKRTILIASFWMFVLSVTLFSGCSPSENKNSNAQDTTWAMLPFKKLNDVNRAISFDNARTEIVYKILDELRWIGK